MKSVTSTDAKAKLNAIIAEVERTGRAITVTSHGRPAVVISPAVPRKREFGQLPGLDVSADFDAPLPDDELDAWEAPSR